MREALFLPRQISDDLRQSTLASFIDLARWLAAVMVMVGHVRNPLLVGWGGLPPDARPLWVKAWYFITGFHAEAVLVFFVISGFLVGGLAAARAFDGRFDPPGYAIDRISRLFIAFIPAVVLTLVLDGAGAHWFGDTGLYNGTHPMIVEKDHGIAYQARLGLPVVLGNLVMAQYYVVPTLGSNDPLWTLSTEFWFYFVFGALLFAVLSRGSPRWLSLLAGMAVTAYLGLEFVMYFGLWLIGFLVACLRCRRAGPPLLPLLILAGWLTYMRFYDAMFDAEPQLKNAAHFVMAVLLGWLILAMRGRRIKLLERLNSFNKFMADFSYSLYLIHFPVLIFVIAMLGCVTNIAGFSHGFLPTNPIGVLSYLGIVSFILIISWLFAQATERHTLWLRGWLRRCLLA